MITGLLTTSTYCQRGVTLFFVLAREAFFNNVGINKPGKTWIALTTIPMGWNSAVSSFQYPHMRMGLGEDPVGFSLPGAWEWRRDAVIPLDPVSDW